MKQLLISITLLTFVATQSASAKFMNESNNSQIWAIESGAKICVAEKKEDGELKLVTKHSIKRPELRKAMRSTTYFNRAIISVTAGSVITSAVSSIVLGPLPASASFQAVMTYLHSQVIIANIVDGVITSSYDDDSHFAYNFITSITGIPFLGERMMRGVRIDNLLSKNQTHKINELRYNKILDIIPTLETTGEACDLNDFSELTK